LPAVSRLLTVGKPSTYFIKFPRFSFMLYSRNTSQSFKLIENYASVFSCI
jgi:hypothetical protein